MKRASYREAIEWLAYNDDNEWLDDEEPSPSVSAGLVRDLFDVDTEKLCADLKKACAKRDREESAS